MAVQPKIPITAANLANWIPTVWSLEVAAEAENSLVTGALFDRTYEKYARAGGNKIIVPTLSNLTAAAVNTAQNMSTYNTIQNAENISLNQAFDVGIIVDDVNQLQDNPDYFSKVRGKVAYALAKQIDVNCGVRFLADWSSQTVGTTGSSLIEANLIDAYEYLNLANAPWDDRAWVFDPESISDLMDLDYFVNMDYVPDSVSKKGFRGREIFGSPVYISTNLDYYASTLEHQAAYFQREATALVVQMQPTFELGRLPLQHSDVLVGMCVFGVKTIFSTFGVLINCRS